MSTLDAYPYARGLIDQKPTFPIVLDIPLLSKFKNLLAGFACSRFD